MDLKQVMRIWLKLEAIEDEVEEAAPGDEVPIPTIKGIRIGGKKGRIQDAVFVPDADG